MLLDADTPSGAPDTPPRERNQLRRRHCIAAQQAEETNEWAVHAEAVPLQTSSECLLALASMLLVFGGVPYVLPAIPLYCVAMYAHYKSTWAMLLLAFWFTEVLAPPRVHNTWPRACHALRWSLWHSWRAYTRYELISETELDPAGTYVFAAHPHGVFPLAQWLTIDVSTPASRASDPVDAAIAAAFPMRCRGAVASVMLRLPVLRHVLEWAGIVPAHKDIVHTLLEKHRESVVLVPGGIAELYQTSLNEEVLVLKNRKGFIKAALESNATAVVPIYCFGVTHTFCLRPPPSSLIKLARRARISAQAFWGRWGLPLPFNHKLLVVIGPTLKPLPGEDVDSLHARYCAALEALYHRHKHRVGWSDKPLRLI
jgi:diacylglycerol O-acyltransferase 2, plant